MSAARLVAVAVLLGVTAVLTLISAVGVLVMRDPLQRLHFMAPPATSAFLVVAALAIDGAPAELWIKAIIVAILLMSINGVLTHATARAVYVHDRGHWPPSPEEIDAGEREGGS